MDYDKFAKEDEFHKWFEYEPNEVRYLKYANDNPSLIAAGHKIVDVYYAFADAHATFMFAGTDDFGSISSDDEMSKLYAKSHFLRYAILEYGLCLDLSWQVIWAYIQPTSLDYLMRQEYKKMEKECDRDSVLQQLDCSISIEKNSEAERIKKIFKDFDADVDIINLRSLYNVIKHQGTIHIEGLGKNEKQMMIVIGEEAPPVLHRKSYAVEELEEMLKKYNDKFITYMNKLISEIMPSEYLESRVEIGNVIDTISAIQNRQK